jgi:oligogalacturonide lyase
MSNSSIGWPVPDPAQLTAGTSPVRRLLCLRVLFRACPFMSTKKTFRFLRAVVLSAVLSPPLGFLAAARAETPAAAAPEPPTSWIDPATGHRVIRLTREPGSDSFYFNVNGYTPDGKQMAYTTTKGISVLNLTTLEARQVVAGAARAIVVGHKTPTIYFTRPGKDSLPSTLWSTNVDTGETRKLADLPRRASVVTINADETLGAGTFIEGDASAGGAYDGTAPSSRMSSTNLGEPVNKSEMMARRLEARLPMTMFTIDLRTGEVKDLLEHSTDWLNHLQFSPTDPTLLMYCHEGLWWLVNRIWTIRTDGTHNQLVS